MTKTQKQQNVDKLINCFDKNNPVRILFYLLEKNQCSLRTLQRRIKSTNVIRSYNHNGKFYTMPFLTNFNKNGIWHHNLASFSKWGNLYDTIVFLINKSFAGYSTKEISAILKTKIYDALSILSKQHRIKRIKIATNNIYFSVKDDIYLKQYENRKKEYEKETKLYHLPQKDLIIKILVEIVLNNTIEIKKLEEVFRKKGVLVSSPDIQAVILHYGLKKKLSNSRTN